MDQKYPFKTKICPPYSPKLCWKCFKMYIITSRKIFINNPQSWNCKLVRDLELRFHNQFQSDGHHVFPLNNQSLCGHCMDSCTRDMFTNAMSTLPIFFFHFERKYANYQTSALRFETEMNNWTLLWYVNTWHRAVEKPDPASTYICISEKWLGMKMDRPGKSGTQRVRPGLKFLKYWKILVFFFNIYSHNFIMRQ